MGVPREILYVQEIILKNKNMEIKWMDYGNKMIDNIFPDWYNCGNKTVLLRCVSSREEGNLYDN